MKKILMMCVIFALGVCACSKKEAPPDVTAEELIQSAKEALKKEGYTELDLDMAIGLGLQMETEGMEIKTDMSITGDLSMKTDKDTFFVDGALKVKAGDMEESTVLQNWTEIGVDATHSYTCNDGGNWLVETTPTTKEQTGDVTKIFDSELFKKATVKETKKYYNLVSTFELKELIEVLNSFDEIPDLPVSDDDLSQFDGASCTVTLSFDKETKALEVLIVALEIEPFVVDGFNASLNEASVIVTVKELGGTKTLEVPEDVINSSH